MESILNKAEDPQACNFIKKDSNTGVFLWNLQILVKKCILFNASSKSYSRTTNEFKFIWKFPTKTQLLLFWSKSFLHYAKA